jgi:hypothetical protein
MLSPHVHVSIASRVDATNCLCSGKNGDFGFLDQNDVLNKQWWIAEA